MLAVTADTNIYVSAFQFGGLPRRFMDLAAEEEFRLDISEAILNETLRVLREKFLWNLRELRAAEENIRGYALIAGPTLALDVIAADPTDNRVLECAVAANSDFIVSGDVRHVLPLCSYRGIKIVKVADFLEVLKSGPVR